MVGGEFGGGSSSGSFVRLQPGCWLGLPLTKGLTGATGPASKVASPTVGELVAAVGSRPQVLSIHLQVWPAF